MVTILVADNIVVFFGLCFLTETLFASFCSYTWKIYAYKLLNMGSMYSFWRQLNKEQKLAKQRYIELFYNLKFRELVCTIYSHAVRVYIRL